MERILTNDIRITLWCKRFLLSIVLLLTISIVKADYHAFIIAIGDYPDGNGWSDISSQNDVGHIVAALEIVGFQSENIVIIKDQQATRNGILKAFDQFMKKIGPGDQVYVHYSGHGQQIMDDANEEIDQLDEAIVPYDSPLYYETGVYEGKNLIRDDELQKISNRIRKKIGKSGQLVWVLDSCHSGTGLRGIGKARGTDIIMASSDFKPKVPSIEKSMEINNTGLKNLAPMLSLFGSSPRELNFETLDEQSKPVGSLSYSISQVLAEMNQPYSFEDFFSLVQQKMKVNAPRQSPQWEGPENVLLFEGQLMVTKNESFKVVEMIDATRYKIDAGSLADVYEGSTVKIFASSDPEVFAEAKVIHSNFNNSIVEIENGMTVNSAEILRVQIIERAAPSIQLIVRNDTRESELWGPIIESSLSTINFIESDVNPDLYFRAVDHNLQVETKEGLTVMELPYSQDKDELIKQIATQVRSYLQAKFLRSFNSDLSDFDFQLSIVQVDCQTEESLIQDQENETKLKVGSCIKFKIRNNGLVGAYFSLIDIQPDNVINLVIPAVHLDYTASEYYLKPGEDFVTSYAAQIAEPLGEETLKLITSKKPLEIADIIASQGNMKKGIKQLNDFEQQFATSFHKSNEAIIRSNKDALGVVTLYLSIVE